MNNFKCLNLLNIRAQKLVSSGPEIDPRVRHMTSAVCRGLKHQIKQTNTQSLLNCHMVYDFFLQDFYVVLLSPCDLDSSMKMLLQVPMWAQRVIFIQGSALKDTDLARCR